MRFSDSTGDSEKPYVFLSPKQPKACTGVKKKARPPMLKALGTMRKSLNMLKELVKNTASLSSRSSQSKFSTVTLQNFENTIRASLPCVYVSVLELVSNVDKQWLTNIFNAPFPCLEWKFDKYEGVPLIFQAGMAPESVGCNSP